LEKFRAKKRLADAAKCVQNADMFAATAGPSSAPMADDDGVAGADIGG